MQNSPVEQLLYGERFFLYVQCLAASNSFPYDRLYTSTRSEKEVKSNSEMAYWVCLNTRHNWLKNSHHFFLQSEVNPKSIVIRSHTFSRASPQVHAFSTSFDWFIRLSLSSTATGSSGCFR